MMARDLDAARSKWIQETHSPLARSRREESDFLACRNHDGLFADFHFFRHLLTQDPNTSELAPKLPKPWPGTASFGRRPQVDT
jgi:hypothetical protein